MNTGSYVKPSEIIFFAAGNAGDKELRMMSKGFFMANIQRAWEELNMESSFKTGHADFKLTKSLSYVLPEDCFDVRNVWVYSGDKCTVENSKKVWWKRNYFPKEHGYFANDKGHNSDPFYKSHSAVGSDKSLIRYNDSSGVNKILFYNIQNGFLAISSSCLSAGNMLHIEYGSTGSAVTESPIIPVYFKTAMEDYTTEAALRFRMANEPSMIRTWAPLQQLYERRLDKEGMNGSWHNAVQRVKRMNKVQREDLYGYLGRGGWAQGR